MKDHTTLGWFSSALGKSESGFEKIEYKNYLIYENLPPPCKCPEIKAEWEAYWNWKHNQPKEMSVELL